MVMKKSVIAVSLAGLLQGVCPADEPVAPKNPDAAAAEVVELASDTDKINYSLGYELGKDLERQELEFAREALLRGVQDALSGAKPLVNTMGRKVALKDIKEKRHQENVKKSLAFLTANAEQGGVKTLPSGLQYRELRAGEGKSPDIAGSVTVHYRGTLIDGSEFDSSYERGKPATFQVKKVIKGWREALQLMREGAKWELTIPPDLAYGKRGHGKRIPPGSALVYEVELISVGKAPERPSRPSRPQAPAPAGD